MSCANRDVVLVSTILLALLLIFSFAITLTKTSTAVLIKSRESGHPFPVPDLRQSF